MNREKQKTIAGLNNRKADPPEKGVYLLKGDISGIQEYIFNVKSDGAAKTLKARSYYVQVLGKLASKFVLANLEDAELFYEGGGNFFIEFKHDERTIDSTIDTIRTKLNESQRLEDLLIHLSYIKKYGENDFWTSLRAHSNEEKLIFFGDDINFFEPYSQKQEINFNKFPQVEAWLSKISGLNSENNLYKSLTEIMVKEGNILVKLLGGEFDEQDASFKDSLINKLPLWNDYAEKDIYKEFRRKSKNLYPDNNELKDYNIVDFDALGDFAAHRTGTNKIGILKLDVDNLGKLFRKAKPDNEVKEYSKIFSTFFTETIYTALYNTRSFRLLDSTPEESYRANIYPIFAGGDDCFIIGSWDAVLCFARDLHDLFCNDEDIKSIKLGNQPMTFSAGIVLVDPTHPVVNFSELAEEALAQAKSTGKNRVSVLGLSFSWDDYKQILETSKLIADEMLTKNISRAYLDKIRKSAKGFNALQNRDGVDFDKIYKLKYYLSKNNDKLGTIVEKLFVPYYNTLKSRLLKNTSTKVDVAIYPAITRITELLTKNKLNYGTGE